MALPLLREEIDLHEGPRLRDGQPTWTLHDPARNQFFRIDWQTFCILRHWGLDDPQRICEQVATETTLRPNDVGHVDVHPISADGWWGDCTRTFQLGSDGERTRAFETVRRIHDETLARCTPGMQACDLFNGCFESIQAAGYKLHDPWSNIGHSLKRGSAYDEKFIDATNEREMWGAWAVEPFLGTDAFGVKLEDVVWFGEEGCEVLR